MPVGLIKSYGTVRFQVKLNQTLVHANKMQNNKVTKSMSSIGDQSDGEPVPNFNCGKI